MPQVRWTDGSIEYALCAVCNAECCTHNFASHPLTFCGDCGLACCSSCCDDSQATLCLNCRAADYFLTVGDSEGYESHPYDESN